MILPASHDSYQALENQFVIQLSSLYKCQWYNPLFSCAAATTAAAAAAAAATAAAARSSSFCTSLKRITARWMDSVIECHRVSSAKSIQACLVPDARYFPY